jgi:hypothetical protein
VAAVALLHHPARVEHGVVHAHGQADDHHQLGHVGWERVELAERPEQTDRARDGSGAEHERDAGGDERAERDQQDDQQQAVGDRLRALPVPRVLGGDLLGGRDLAELLDPHAGVGGLHGGHGGERLLDELLDVLVRARHREVHDDRAAVPGDRVGARSGIERALDLGDALDLLQALHDIPHGGRHLRSVRRDRALALHEHLLAGLVGEPRGLDDHVAALGLAVTGGRLVEVVLPHRAAEDGRQDDEQDPAQDGCLAVVGTPSTGAGGEITGLHVGLLLVRTLYEDRIRTLYEHASGVNRTTTWAEPNQPPSHEPR